MTMTYEEAAQWAEEISLAYLCSLQEHCLLCSRFVFFETHSNNPKSFFWPGDSKCRSGGMLICGFNLVCVDFFCSIGG